MAEENWLTDALRAVTGRLQEVIPEAGAEFKRLGVQGSMELASALFNGSAFVPYGPGQYTPSFEASAAPESAATEAQPPAREDQQERGGMER